MYVIRDENGSYWMLCGTRAGLVWSEDLKDAQMFDKASYAARLMAAERLESCDIVRIEEVTTYRELEVV